MAEFYEPWRIEKPVKVFYPEGVHENSTIDDAWDALLIVDFYGDEVCSVHGDVDNTKKAERILACVNACAGINPEAVPALLNFAKKSLEAAKSLLGDKSCQGDSAEAQQWVDYITRLIETATTKGTP
jgi:hypothetical protein